MKSPTATGNHAVWSYVVVLVFSFVLSSVSATEGETLDIQAFLPLFEQNTLGRKILDVSYSEKFAYKVFDKIISGTRDTRLIFDAETGNYREEEKYYDDPSDTNVYSFTVRMWNGKESVAWVRPVSTRPGSRDLGQGVYEHAGNAGINGTPLSRIPPFVSFYYDTSSNPFAKTVRLHNPKLGDFAGDTVTIETLLNKFVFSKKNCALEGVYYYNPIGDTRDDKTVAWVTYELSDHVELSGIWIPLRIVITGPEPSGREKPKVEISVDPKTLRLLDKVEDPSIFNEQLPAGCMVNDTTRKKSYMVKTVDRLPNDVDAIQKMLEKLLEQADEQKAAIEEEIKAKKKKK